MWRDNDWTKRARRENEKIGFYSDKRKRNGVDSKQVRIFTILRNETKKNTEKKSFVGKILSQFFLFRMVDGEL